MKLRQEALPWASKIAVSFRCEEGWPDSSHHEPKETALPAGTRRAIALVTAFFAADDLEATARRTGFVQRTSQSTGPRFLALVTFGTWREGQTPLAQRAAQGTPVCQPGAVSPAALHQRLPKQALALLQARLRQGLATLPSLTPAGRAQGERGFAGVS